MLTRERRLQAFQALSQNQIVNSSGSDFRCEITNEDDSNITIAIRGVVGDYFEENDHATVVAKLEANPTKNVTLRVNSMGGSVFDGFGIANALLAHEGEVTAIIEGVAYSAASFLVLAADKVVAFKASTYGIHRSLTLTYGNQVEHQATIERLNAIDEILIELYVEKTGLPEAEIIDLIDGTADGTMLKAVDAHAKGFVDEIYSPPKKSKDKKTADSPAKSEAATSTFAEIKAQREVMLRRREAEESRRRVQNLLDKLA